MSSPQAILRVARPTDQLEPLARQYEIGLGLQRLFEFQDHDGFDGVMLGHPQHPWHLEFTHHRGTSVGRAPTPDNLLVFYLPDAQEWEQSCAQMREAGFKEVPSYNPYWDNDGKTFEDLDGYRIVLQCAEWDL